MVSSYQLNEKEMPIQIEHFKPLTLVTPGNDRFMSIRMEPPPHKMTGIGSGLVFIRSMLLPSNC